MDTVPAYPRIPYGEGDFRRIRLRGWLYVDKTRFLRRLEDQERYAFLIRPRRFGKTLWVSLLRELLRPLLGRRLRRHVRRHRRRAATRPEEQSRYVTLRFNFSMVNDKLETLEREFETYCMIEFRGTLRAASGPVSRSGACSGHPRSALHRQQARRAVPVRRRPRHPAVRADRRVRQLRQYGAGVPRRRGVPRLHPRRRLLPQLLRHPQGRHGAQRRRHRPPVHHRRVAGDHGRRDLRLQHRHQHQPRPGLQRDGRLHRGGGAEPGRDVPGPGGVFNQDVETAMGIMGEWYNGYRFADGRPTPTSTTPTWCSTT